jgi:hypothetical protein
MRCAHGAVALSVRARPCGVKVLCFSYTPLQQFTFWKSTGITLRFEFKALDHEISQVVPAVKDHVTHEGLDSNKA